MDCICETIAFACDESELAVPGSICVSWNAASSSTDLICAASASCCDVKVAAVDPPSSRLPDSNAC
jgi:hypothetical protein